MGFSYELFLHCEAAACFHALRRAEKEPLRRFLDALEEYPHLAGETTELDAVGRAVEVKAVGRLKVVYWTDHAMKEVKVLRIEHWQRG
jgi:hypothetical protein